MKKLTPVITFAPKKNNVEQEFIVEGFVRLPIEGRNFYLSMMHIHSFEVNGEGQLCVYDANGETTYKPSLTLEEFADQFDSGEEICFDPDFDGEEDAD